MKNFIIIAILYLAFGLNLSAQDFNLKFEINQSYREKDVNSKNGRLFIVFSKEPTYAFNGIQYPDLSMNPVFGVDISDWKIDSSSKHFKFESISSRLLTGFWNKTMSVEVQVVLPKSYYVELEKEYPLLVMIGGFGERYYNKLIIEKELFDPSLPQMIIVLIDSKAPFGDSYQTNSANNGPYGDALVDEVIPYIESKYRCVGDSTSRFLTGTSTGGWASLALQIFYPDFFNGVWLHYWITDENI